MQGLMPSTDGAISLGVGIITLLKGPGLLGPISDAKTSDRPHSVTLPSAHVSTLFTQGSMRSGRAHGRYKHADIVQLGGMIALRRLVAQKVTA
jgi:hypothetical protein